MNMKDNHKVLDAYDIMRADHKVLDMCDVIIIRFCICISDKNQLPHFHPSERFPGFK